MFNVSMSRRNVKIMDAKVCRYVQWVSIVKWEQEKSIIEQFQEDKRNGLIPPIAVLEIHYHGRTYQSGNKYFGVVV